MNVQISTQNQSIRLPIQSFVINMSGDTRYGNVNLGFSNGADSLAAFNKLRDIGVRCYHAGVNAPHGASVMVYACDRNDLKLQINDTEND